MSAAAVRLNEVAGWSSALLQWRRDGGGWRFRFGSAVPIAMQGNVRSAPSTSSVLDRLRRHEGDMRVRLPVAVRRAVVEMDAEVSVRGTCALALVPCSSFYGRARSSGN